MYLFQKSEIDSNFTVSNKVVRLSTSKNICLVVARSTRSTSTSLMVEDALQGIHLGSSSPFRR